MKLLVIDDHLAVGRSIQMALASVAIDVSVAASGLEGIELARADAFDVILLDIAMPDMDGFETLRVFKNDTRLQAIPVIMMSGWCGEESVRKATAAGAVAFLEKPLKVEELKQMILGVARKTEAG